MALTRLTPTTRKTLQILGPMLIIVGITLVVIAVRDMPNLSADGGMGKFGLAFIGIPVLFVGAVISQIGFMKPMSELVVTETADAASHGAHNIAKAAMRGVNEAGGLNSNIKIRCRACGELDDEHAKFCSGCGQTM
jgi:hypothetical protein